MYCLNSNFIPLHTYKTVFSILTPRWRGLGGGSLLRGHQEARRIHENVYSLYRQQYALITTIEPGEYVAGTIASLQSDENGNSTRLDFDW